MPNGGHAGNNLVQRVGVFGQAAEPTVLIGTILKVTMQT